ncbi:MAG: DUF2628 domain-containing protein [Filomicrobium sp.]
MLLTLSRIGAQNRVVAYTVHEPPTPMASPEEQAERLVFVRDGFSWFAFLLSPVWMLVNRMWLAFLIYAVVVGALFGTLGALGVAPDWVALASLALHFLIALEADSIERWTLNRRGWLMIGSVSGANARECERRFFEGWIERQAVPDQVAGGSLYGGQSYEQPAYTPPAFGQPQ